MKKSLIVVLSWFMLSAFTLGSGPVVTFESGTAPRLGNKFTVEKYASNPVLENSATETDPDYVAVRDTAFVHAGSTYTIVYSGFVWDETYYIAAIMAATASSREGAYTKQGALDIPYTASLWGNAGNTMNTMGDPFVLFDNGTWHLWVTCINSSLSRTQSRQIGHLTNTTGSATSFPLTGWTWENAAAVTPSTTGWTSDGAGTAIGVCAPKVFPATGGGWIMYLCNWGPYTATEFQIGYATATSLNGPWTVQTALVGEASGYQAEQPTYFKHNGTHYMLINRLGLSGRGVSNWEDLHCDLWSCSTQTGTWVLEQYDFLPRGTGAEWDSGTMGVISIEDYDISPGETVYGVYDANALPYAQLPRDIGSFSITVP